MKLNSLHARTSELVDMLSYRRPFRGRTVDTFCERFLRPLGATPDAFGNWIAVVGDAPILWSSHTDTVHYRDGRQTVSVSEDGYARLSKRSRMPNESNCLGADCTAGVWIMAQMIRAGVAGTYVFHAGEERGGHGSSYLLETREAWLRSFTHAIAFDRRGSSSVITHQGNRTASATFAQAFAAELDRCGLKGYEPDDTGVFTDTAIYSDVIAECSNVSVGYDREHSSAESLDLVHIAALAHAMSRFNVASLVVDRDPELDAMIERERQRRQRDEWEAMHARMSANARQSLTASDTTTPSALRSTDAPKPIVWTRADVVFPNGRPSRVFTRAMSRVWQSLTTADVGRLRSTSREHALVHLFGIATDLDERIDADELDEILDVAIGPEDSDPDEADEPFEIDYTADLDLCLVCDRIGDSCLCQPSHEPSNTPLGRRFR